MGFLWIPAKPCEPHLSTDRSWYHKVRASLTKWHVPRCQLPTELSSPGSRYCVPHNYAVWIAFFVVLRVMFSTELDMGPIFPDPVQSNP